MAIKEPEYKGIISAEMDVSAGYPSLQNWKIKLADNFLSDLGITESKGFLEWLQKKYKEDTEDTSKTRYHIITLEKYERSWTNLTKSDFQEQVKQISIGQIEDYKIIKTHGDIRDVKMHFALEESA